MKGHYQIGDLTFTVEGDLKELAHCQEIIREIRRAEYRLQKAAGSDSVYLIYDQDLEGDRGTFDKMRLRTYGDNDHSYTLDIGSTDNNPLGIYVGRDQNVQVYDYDQGAVVAEITPEGKRISAGAEDRRQGTRERPARKEGEGSPDHSQGQQGQQESAYGLRTVEADRELVGEAEMFVQDGNAHKQIDAKQANILRNTLERSGLTPQDQQAVCDHFNVQTFDDLTFGQVKDVYRFIKDLTEFDEAPY